MFCDESSFQQFIVKKSHGDRSPGKQYDEKCTISVMKHPSGQTIREAILKRCCWTLFLLSMEMAVNVI